MRKYFPAILSATLVLLSLTAILMTSIIMPVSEIATAKTPTLQPLTSSTMADRHQVMPDTWVFTDGLGRESLTYEDVGGVKDDRTLAMFYWTWHTRENAARGYVNTTELLKRYPDAKNDYNHVAWKNTGRFCFWNEPIYGYYSTEDPWVLRRQAELLANAGVDTIITDNTNGTHTWRESYLQLYKTWDDAQKNGGVNVPKVSYMLPFWDDDCTYQQIKVIYNDIYRYNKYQNLWFYWDDKPFIMARHNSFSSGSTTLDAEIYDFFTWRAGQPEYKTSTTVLEKWGWLSTYPQTRYYKTKEDRRDNIVEQMSVGVAVNHNYKTHQITAMNGEYVMGRSYTSQYPNRYAQEGSNASLWGYQFSEQFDYALKFDPKVLFVTGWNEWHAWRQPDPWGGSNSKVNNALVDQFDNEFSRDLEPTKGELKDHYYYLFVNYARQYKGVNPIPTPSKAKSIRLSGDESQWATVEPYYAAYVGNTGDRNYTGYGHNVYTETSGRNDIAGAQIARDNRYIYFHVECVDNITPYTDNLWMTLYIDSDQNRQGWETFDYVINKSPASAQTVVLEQFTGRDYATRKIADCEYVVNGKYMTVKVAKEDLGLSGHDYTINFAWTDNVHDEGDTTKFSGDIMDFYISGDVAPGARFKYSYISDEYNFRGEEKPIETETVAQTVVQTDVITTEQAQETMPASVDTQLPPQETQTEAEATVEEAHTTAEIQTSSSIQADTNENTPADTVIDTSQNTTASPSDTSSSGCASVMTMTSIWLLSLCGVALLSHKKRD